MTNPSSEHSRKQHSNNVEDLAAALQVNEGVMLVARSLAPEYVKMFDLNLTSLPKSTNILDVASGVSSFGMEMRALGFTVTSVDPVYELAAEEIQRKALPFLADWASMFASMDSFSGPEGEAPAWLVDCPLEEIDSPAKMLAIRRAGLEKFVNDFRTHGSAHYIAATLPALVGVQGTYDLILCGNFLMAYTSKNLEMTIASIETLAQRLSDKGQIRIYPGGSAFERIEAELQEALFRKGLHLDVVPSEHRFVKGWDAMYRITKMSLGPGPQ